MKKRVNEETRQGTERERKKKRVSEKKQIEKK
jgi:hypothetical protein